MSSLVHSNGSTPLCHARPFILFFFAILSPGHVQPSPQFSSYLRVTEVRHNHLLSTFRMLTLLQYLYSFRYNI
ncbi:hypothetical protein P691DRAFT_52307 [Macrolepiota fuliginosa MF-IS2]|uniref:Uncharacterized protein n=1 Tax=Macrolepiota fuliginosa MF-IS2 TaxID=1400762 RepID=A0A9P5X0Y2_9AGAR|nr:hypothetical protein P691DRAFT_52307 [Macrolepiota fuliginosa MF-IS2]